MSLPEFVVTCAPFRVSFAGGGTDLPSFYQKDYGVVMSSAIDKYVYVMVNCKRPILHQGIDDQGRYRIRLSYSTTEYVQRPDELSHPIVREAMKLLDLDIPMDIATMADVPSGTGLGSSGTFSVALLHALHLVKGDSPGPDQLADEAARIEINLLGRPVGKQDHYAAAFGGLNMIRFMSDDQVIVDPIGSSKTVAKEIFSYLMLVYTGQSRHSGTVLAEQNENVESKMDPLLDIRDHALQLEEMVKCKFDINVFGSVLHKTWMRKRQLAKAISSEPIDHWYDMAIEAGALGGKICGAGGGGFLLLVVEPSRRQAVREVLKDLDELTIGYEPNGSHSLVPKF